MEGFSGITIIDIIISVIFLYFIISGYEQGFINQTSKIFGLIFALFMGVRYSNNFLVYLEPYFNLPPALMHVISFAIIFIVVNLVVLILGNVVKQIIELLFLGILDSTAGAIFGFVKGAILVYFLVFILNEIPYEGLTAMMNESFLASNMMELTPIIQENIDQIFGDHS